MEVKDIIAEIDAEISRLQQARSLLAGRKAATSFDFGARKKRTLSAEARAKIAAAQKKRWAKAKRASSNQ